MSITLSNLSKSFDGFKAVDNISLHIDEGSFCCVVGPSGCGKSTLLRMIAGLEVPDTGSIEINDNTVAGVDSFISAEDRHVGVVFQSYALWPHLSVIENVAFPYKTRGVKNSESLRKAEHHLSSVALSGFADRKPDSLSGGQRQRVALARCLAGEVNTILMDEPLANLDPHLRIGMEEELKAFHQSAGVTTLYITHDQKEAMALADQLAVMWDGRILQCGSPHEVYEQPNSIEVAQFIGKGSLLTAEIDDDVATVANCRFPVANATGGRQCVFVRPKQITSYHQRDNIESAGGEVPGIKTQVIDVAYRGGYWEIRARINDTNETLQLELNRSASVGEAIFVSITSGWALPTSTTLP